MASGKIGHLLIFTIVMMPGSACSSAVPSGNKTATPMSSATKTIGHARRIMILSQCIEVLNQI